ncbi:hypothetical protein J0H58_22045 [bacterium]|nr:hypothetical protein [bacterium]
MNKETRPCRTAFAQKCAGYLQRGIGVVIVDVVTSLPDGPFATLLRSMDVRPEAEERSPRTSIAALAPQHGPAGNSVAVWHYALNVGEPFPVVPLALRGGPIIPLDVGPAYETALRGMNL